MCGWLSLPASAASARNALCIMRPVGEGIAREVDAAGRSAADLANDRVFPQVLQELELHRHVVRAFRGNAASLAAPDALLPRIGARPARPEPVKAFPDQPGKNRPPRSMRCKRRSRSARSDERARK